jgi:hypothetical protein
MPAQKVVNEFMSNRLAMVTSRPLIEEDLPMLQTALDNNKFHPGQKVDAFIAQNMYSEVYSDDQGPIGILRYTKSLRLVTCWLDNDDRERNAASVIQAISDAKEKAKANGFTEILFSTNSVKLKAFCETLGFKEDKDSTMILYV